MIVSSACKAQQNILCIRPQTESTAFEFRIECIVNLHKDINGKIHLVLKKRHLIKKINEGP